MLDLFVMAVVVFCLTQFLKAVGLVAAKHFLPAALCIGITLGAAYRGGDFSETVLLGAGGALCAWLAERIFIQGDE